MENEVRLEVDKKRLIVKLRKLDSSQNEYGLESKIDAENSLETISIVQDEIISKTVVPNNTHNLEDRMFRCDICQIWFTKIEKLFKHVESAHEDIQLTKDLEVALLNQWNNILSVEKSVMKCISNNKIKSAKRHLKCSLPVLRGFCTSLFVPNDNIFEPFISMMQTRLKSIIKRSKMNVSENINKVNGNIISLSVNSETSIGSKSKKRKHSAAEALDSTNQNGRNISDFSSDDEICLRDAIKLHKSNEIKGENNINDLESDESDDVLPVMEYYLVPQRENGEALNFLEKSLIYTAMKSVIKKKEVNLDKFNDVILKRFDLDMDEVVPEGVYMVSENMFFNKCNSWREMKLCDFLSKSRPKRRKKRRNKSDEDEASDDESSSDDEAWTSAVTDFRCEICDLHFNKFKAKEEHERLHTMYECSWYCPVCESQFPTLLSIKSHYKEKKCKNVNGKVIKYYKESTDAPECKQCGRIFTSVGRLNQHIKHLHDGIAFRKNQRNKSLDESDKMAIETIFSKN